MPEKPIENSYWVIPGKFLAGEYQRDKAEESSRQKINAFIQSGNKPRPVIEPLPLALAP